MADAPNTTPDTGAENDACALAAGVLLKAQDAHATRSLSFASTLHLALTSAEMIRGDDLLALSEALADHIVGLTDAISAARRLLAGSAEA